jgi:hypothetical protein
LSGSLSGWFLVWLLVLAVVAAAGFAALYLIVTERRRHEEVEAENARLLEEARVRQQERSELADRLITAEQDERRRLALFLHDVPVQSMSGIALMLDGVFDAIDRVRNVERGDGPGAPVTGRRAPERVGADRRADELARRRAPPERVPAPGWVERRVGEDPPAAHLDEGGRPTHVGDADPCHLGACSSAQSRTRSAISSQPFCAGRRCA